MFPWPSFGSFQFKKTETAHWETDSGWALAPTYSQTRPIGSNKDHIIAVAIGSATRSFEVNLEQDRFNILQGMLNTVAEFTDWTRPIPSSRQAFLTEVVPVEQLVHLAPEGGSFNRELRVRISLVSQ